VNALALTPRGLGQDIHFTIYRPDSVSFLPTTNRIEATVEFTVALRKEKELQKTFAASGDDDAEIHIHHYPV
jgi:hypothetical protein